MTRELPSIEELRKIFRADFDTGKVYKILPDGSERDIKGSDNGQGYLLIRFLGKNIRNHRLIFALYHGRWPVKDIDHINGDTKDNCIVNLREVTVAENNRNCKINDNNTSGCSGVYFNKATRKWMARIGNHSVGTYEYLGIHENLEDAIAARKEAEIRHGYHPNHGREG